jgi:hypothetical protein
MIDPLKKRRMTKKYSYQNDIFQDLDDMEVDTSEQILDWASIQLAKSKALVEELDHEGPIVFKDDFVTLHRRSYQKDTEEILLQCDRIKGKHVTNKWGS